MDEFFEARILNVEPEAEYNGNVFTKIVRVKGLNADSVRIFDRTVTVSEQGDVGKKSRIKIHLEILGKAGFR
jgi:hypothetical protein